MNSQRVIAQCVRTIRPHYVCQRCRALHISPRSQALFDQKSLLDRMKSLITGTKNADSRKRQPVSQETAIQETTTQETPAKQEQVVADARTIRIGNKDYEVAAGVAADFPHAETWQGLERIGSDEWQKEQRDQGEVYESFLPDKVELSPGQWRALLRHTLIEAMIFSKHGVDICNDRHEGFRPWEITSNTSVTIEDGSVNIRFATAGDEQALVDSVLDTSQEPLAPEMTQAATTQQASDQSIETEATSDTLDPLNEHRPYEEPLTHLQALLRSAAEQQVSEDAWNKIPLTDPALKFAIVKRIMQLTGLRIPDMAISGAKDVEALCTAGLVMPKPKKLIESLQKFNVIPNVTVYDKRMTAIDKDKEAGRWKLIEQELIRRDLPVNGTRWRDAKLITQA